MCYTAKCHKPKFGRNNRTGMSNYKDCIHHTVTCLLLAQCHGGANGNFPSNYTVGVQSLLEGPTRVKRLQITNCAETPFNEGSV